MIANKQLFGIVIIIPNILSQVYQTHYSITIDRIKSGCMHVMQDNSSEHAECHTLMMANKLS